jgi:hypothetical protein
MPGTTEPLTLPSSPEDEERAPLLGHGFTNPPPKNYSSATLRSEGPTPSVTFFDEDEDTPIHVNSTHRQHYRNPDLSVQPQDLGSSQAPPRPIRRQSHLFYSFPNTPRSPISLPSEADPEPESTNVRGWEKIKAVTHTVGEFMTPPMWAALASLVVACIRPIQYVLEAHLSPVRGALKAAGDCSIPLTLLVLGGYFDAKKDGAEFQQLPSTDHDEDATPRPGEDGHCGLRGLGRPMSEATLVGSWSRAWKGLKIKVRTTPKKPVMRKGETATVFVSVMSRMIITPMLLMPVCVLLTKYATHDVFNELSGFLYSPNINANLPHRP